MVRDLDIEEAFQIKIRATLAQKNKSYVRWCALSYEKTYKNKLKLTITYDMRWQKRSSGRIYDCSSGHAFVISGISKGIIGTIIY